MLMNIKITDKVNTNHTKYINCLLVLNNDIIATGSKDKTIKLWKIKTFELIITLLGHKDNVCCLSTFENTT